MRTRYSSLTLTKIKCATVLCNWAYTPEAVTDCLAGANELDAIRYIGQKVVLDCAFKIEARLGDVRYNQSVLE